MTPARHQWFDEWRGARGLPLRGLVQEVAGQVAQHEATTAARRRKRREGDHQRHLNSLEVVVANLAHAVLLPPETGRLAVLMGKPRKAASRYSNPTFGKPFPALLSGLDELGMLSFRGPSTPWREASSIAPTTGFAARVRAGGLTTADFRQLPREEVILLKQKTGKAAAAASTTPALVDYAETGETTAMRSTVRGLNTFLERAEVSFVDDGRGAIDHRNRRLRRHFVLLPNDKAPRFDRSGRLFGGFWQNLERTRRAGIRIEGETVVDLDFAAMFPRLAYATTGTVPPEGDLYAIEGLGPEHRPALKLAMNALLFDDFTRRKWPDPENDDAPTLPPEWTVARTKAAIVRRHPSLRGCFGCGLGYSLMNTESIILVHVLDEMRSRGIVGLGMHDGLLVPRSRADEGRTIMEEVARGITSQALPVVVKTGG